MARLLTLNVAGCRDVPETWRDRMARIAACVRDHSVDIVMLQSTGSPEPLKTIAAAMTDHRLVITTADMAVFASGAVEVIGEHALSRAPHPEDANDRSVVAIRVGECVLVAANFSWVAELAAANVAETIAFARGFPDVLLAGDLNQEPASPAMQALARAGFVDCWARLRDGQDGATFELPDPTMRIDYVWERSGRQRVRSIERLGGPGAPPMSNHAALLVAFDA